MWGGGRARAPTPSLPEWCAVMGNRWLLSGERIFCSRVWRARTRARRATLSRRRSVGAGAAHCIEDDGEEDDHEHPRVLAHVQDVGRLVDAPQP
eukprot:4635561-Prymnesium_polylepis.1